MNLYVQTDPYEVWKIRQQWVPHETHQGGPKWLSDEAN